MERKTSSSWVDIPSEDLTVDTVTQLLGIAHSDEWVVAACADRVVEDKYVQEEIIRVGLLRSADAVDRVKNALRDGGEGAPQKGLLSTYFHENPSDLLLCQLRALLLERSDRLRTYGAMAMEGKWKLGDQASSTEAPVPPETDDPWNDDDPWDQADETLTSEPSGALNDSEDPWAPPFIALPSFLCNELLHTATFLASTQQYGPLKLVMQRHGNVLTPYRFSILDAIPDYEEPTQFQDLLPGFDLASNCEALPQHKPWRGEPDFVENVEVREEMVKPSTTNPHPWDSSIPRREQPLSAEELTSWYQQRVDAIDANSGMIDVALAFVQYGASQGVPGLDLLGEDLSLLARLVYDATGSESSPARQEWSLAQWKSMDVESVVAAYLAGSTPDSIAADIRRLVMPYLFVLESRAERAGHPEPGLPKRYLYEYILNARLEIQAAIFEQSKPTLNANQRVIRNDEDVARLALACLYGSDRLTEWPTMSRIFECLPAWPNVTGEEEEDEADTTLASLAAFVTPTTSRPKCTPLDLLYFFMPLPSSALTRALDVLDVHLESGEILARWNVPAPLRWFLQSANDEAQQRSWATRMARMAAVDTEQGGDALETEDDWVSLMEDMIKLSDGGQGPLRAAFGLLKKDDILKIFFGGLLSSGNFTIAKKLLMPAAGPRPLSSQAVEELCLAMSREFYDNADSGNLHQGEMKLAYDCLSVAPTTPTIKKEREFIEATSRLCSYNLVSRLGTPLSPIEIRLSKDKLGLIAQLLSSNEDAYKHPEVILDLTDKLGYRGDAAARVRALAMLANAALQSEDFTTAASMSEAMAKQTFTLKAAASEGTGASSSVDDAVTLCWHTCFQLGGQSEFRDPKRKLELLSHALKICPADNIPDVLAVWRKVETEVENLPPEDILFSRAPPKRTDTFSSAISDSTHTFVSHLPDLQLHASSFVNPEAAAMAARTLNRVAANFPFASLAKRERVSSQERSSPPSGSRSRSPDITHQARSVLSRGVGWLIGADEQDNP